MIILLALLNDIPILSIDKKQFYSIKPGKLLFWSAVGTKIAATIFAILGLFMAPISIE